MSDVKNAAKFLSSQPDTDIQNLIDLYTRYYKEASDGLSCGSGNYEYAEVRRNERLCNIVKSVLILYLSARKGV